MKVSAISCSVVVYKPVLEAVKPTLESISNFPFKSVYIVDNSSDSSFREIAESYGYTYIFSRKNIGYGKAHNSAIKGELHSSTYHVVINPDIIFNSNVIFDLAEFMDQNPDIGHVMPEIRDEAGTVQYLCKLLPTPVDVFARRFIPFKSVLQSINSKYEMHFADYSSVMDVPYLSGCFMFLRTAALKEIGFFDDRFFMYPEDIDLTRRIHEKYRTVYFPEVFVTHAHGKESYKSLRMLWVHIINMVKYFNKWGWFFDKKRKKINTAIKKKYTDI